MPVYTKTSLDLRVGRRRAGLVGWTHNTKPVSKKEIGFWTPGMLVGLIDEKQKISH